MVINRSVLFLIAACICFAVSLLCDVSAIQSNAAAWEAGGLLALALSFLP